MIQIIDRDQGTPEWLLARAGIPTASMFATVMAEPRYDGTLPQAVIDAMVKQGCTTEQLAAALKASKRKNSNPALTRRKYMRQLAGEIITGQPMESYSNAHMERGHVMEDEARDWYAFAHDVEPERIGFVRNGQKGASPDSFIGANGGLEIKSKLPDLIIELIEKDDFPPEHKAQVQGSLWVCEREWWDIVRYWPGMPVFEKRAYRDEAYISTLASAVDQFNDELAAMVERVKRYRSSPVNLGFGTDAGGNALHPIMAG